MKKAFSLLEIIFVLSIIALLGSFMLKNSFGFLEKAHITTLKTHIALIRNALSLNKNERIRKGLSPYPLVLDKAQPNSANEQLFIGTPDEKLVEYPILSTTLAEKELGKFAKVSPLSYYAYITKEDFIEFIYNNSSGTFSCSYDQDLCKELN
jgi:general secretion pathway protein G